MRFFVAFLFAVAVAPSADAAVYVGNPTMDLRVDRPAHDFVSGDAWPIAVRLGYCGGGSVDIAVDTAVDPVDGFSIAFDAGDWCTATVLWADDVTITGPSYTLLVEHASTTVNLVGSEQYTAMTPFQVLTGTYGGYAPRLVVTVR